MCGNEMMNIEIALISFEDFFTFLSNERKFIHMDGGGVEETVEMQIS